MKECLYCKEPFEAKTDRRKFCSDSCRVMYNRKHGRQDQIKPFQVQALYNEMMEALAKLKSGTGQQPTQVPVPAKPPAANATGVSFYADRLKECTTVSEVETIVKAAQKDTDLMWAEKRQVENMGKELSKEFYND
jgi:predicted nucleic acid-binding Zn ribbon protein